MPSSDEQYCILFYKYHPLTDNFNDLETYRRATELFCTSLKLTGRILIGLSNDAEGINGTLSGTKDDLDAYMHCMLGRDDSKSTLDQSRADVVTSFRKASREFFKKLNLPELFLGSPNDFKWSSWCDSNNNSSKIDGENWFPDLNIKIVKEIVSTGGTFSGITANDTSVGYLTPREWHSEIQLLMKNNEKKKDESKLNRGFDEDVKDRNRDEIETLLIDVRNHKECQIGSFAPGISIDPQTKTFAQFPKWVRDNSNDSSRDRLSGSAVALKSTSVVPAPVTAPLLLKNKRILMYCTGGIRCEKASAYIRQMVPENKGVYHLKGGIHKYLEEFGQGSVYSTESGNNNDGECLFVGKNFVFDRRGALDAKGHGIREKAYTKDALSSQVSFNNRSEIIGKCQYCSDLYDIFHHENVCTVCREPVLVCGKCQLDLYKKQRHLRGLALSTKNGKNVPGNSKDDCRAEYHCKDHFHLKTCYFTSLHGFVCDELEKQLEQLQLHVKDLERIGKKGKQRRRTLRKQIDRIRDCWQDKLGSDKGNCADLQTAAMCRHCGSSTCASDCWGFHGGNTRMVNKKNQGGNGKGDGQDPNVVELKTHKQRSRMPSNQRSAKRQKRQHDLSEIEALHLSNPASVHRNNKTGLRVPPPVIRILRSRVKGRWCGKTAYWVLKNEFGDSFNGLSQEGEDDRLEQLAAAGLICINGLPISRITNSTMSTKASDIVLRNMDTIERIVHWHEPPVCVPPKISFSKYTLPESILSTNGKSTTCPLLYFVNKPASVPVYPAGPYYSNSLLMLLEAQEGLPPKTLIPLHRIDRATSGLLMCATTSSVARVIQGRITSRIKDGEKNPPLKKLYLARVKGKFPMFPASPAIPNECASIASISWRGDEKDIIEVNAPIAVQLEPKDSQKMDGEPLNTMMHRTVSSDGKHSISRFKVISYNSTINHSLVSCYPVTGRGHQLRVHLQLIGFPIHNDIEYGGTINAESRKDQETLSASSMLNVTASTSECLHESTVTAEVVKSAIQLCRCCNGVDGIKMSFNSAQLLGCGHAIDLHAFRYCLSFEEKQHKMSKEEPMELENETTIEFSSDLPSWVSSFSSIEPNKLTWLD